MAINVDELGAHLVLRNHQKKRPSLDLIAAVAELPSLTLSIEGASTLDVTLADPKRSLLRNELVETKSWAEVDGRRFELVRLAKSGDRYTLTFEDSIVAALRRRKKKLSAKGGSTTRADFGRRLAREAHVKFSADPALDKVKVRTVLERPKGTDSWQTLGDVAEKVHARRFSDGKRILMGFDDWLRSRGNPVHLREHDGAVNTIDFDLDEGKRASRATVNVTTELWATPIGTPVRLSDMGPADGAWLVASFRRPLTSSVGVVELTRARHALKEPKKKPKGNKRVADDGEPDYLPDVDGSTIGSTPAGGYREAMVTWALRQVGRDFLAGSTGPDSFDSSGLVEAATAAAGRRLAAPASTQWATVTNRVTVDSAIATRGALLFRVGVDEDTVAVSLGNGSVVEARGPAYGVGVFLAAERSWTGAGIWL